MKYKFQHVANTSLCLSCQHIPPIQAGNVLLFRAHWYNFPVLLPHRASKVFWKQIKNALINPGTIIIPQSRTCKAINFTLGHWDRILRYLESCELPDIGIDYKLFEIWPIEEKLERKCLIMGVKRMGINIFLFSSS